MNKPLKFHSEDLSRLPPEVGSMEFDSSILYESMTQQSTVEERFKELREKWHVRTYIMAQEITDYSLVEQSIFDWWTDKLQSELQLAEQKAREEERERIVEIIDNRIKIGHTSNFNSIGQVLQDIINQITNS